MDVVLVSQNRRRSENTVAESQYARRDHDYPVVDEEPRTGENRGHGQP